MMERYEVIKKSHLQSYFIVRDDAQGVKSSKNKKNTRLHWSCDKSQISLFSYICVAYNFHPPPTFCCFCQASPALPSLLVSLPLPKIIPTFAGHCLSQQAPFFPRGFQYLQPDPSSVPWNLLYLSIVGTWKFEIARWRRVYGFTWPNHPKPRGVLGWQKWPEPGPWLLSKPSLTPLLASASPDACSLFSPTQTEFSHRVGEVVTSHFKDHVSGLCLQRTVDAFLLVPNARGSFLIGWTSVAVRLNPVIGSSHMNCRADTEIKQFSRRSEGGKSDQTPLSQGSANRMLLCPQGLMGTVVKCSFLFLLQSPLSFPGTCPGVHGTGPWENLS